MTIQVVIRTDASLEIGTGHLMRCLTLADLLRKEEGRVLFACRELPEGLCSLVKRKGFSVRRLFHSSEETVSDDYASKHLLRLGVSLETDANETAAIFKNEDGNSNIDWLIVDHYALNERWETQMRPYVKKIMVIDDLADRRHNCDMLLDQNYYNNMAGRYDGLVPNQCQRFLGPQYAFLREEFFEARKRLRQRDGAVKCILVFFGGSDSHNETLKTLRAIQQLNRPDIVIDVVVGILNQNKEQIKQFCAEKSNFVFYEQVENIAQLMAKADLAIGAGGATIWERCFLGLPSIVIAVAHNQIKTTEDVADLGAIWNLGHCNNVSEDDILYAVKKAINSTSIMKHRSISGINLMGRRGEDSQYSVINYIMGK